MNAVIHELVRVDAQHRVSLTDLRLLPGQEVELIIRPSQASPNGAHEPNSLWQLSNVRKLDAPADYSVNFEQVLR